MDVVLQPSHARYSSGDRIFAQEQGARDGRWFERHVGDMSTLSVRKAEVGLRFHRSFRSTLRVQPSIFVSD